MSRFRRTGLTTLQAPAGLRPSAVAEDRGHRPLGRLLFPGGALLALAVLAGLTFAGSPANAAFPGENGKILCAGALERGETAVDADFELYTINPDGSGQTFVTNNGPLLDPADPNSFIDEFDPIFSPDSSQIAFESTRTGQSELYTMNADGSNAERRTFAPGEDRPGSYSPDGRQIVFHSTRDNRDFEVYIMNADGSDQRRLTNRVGQDSNPSWSPDGSRIAFHSTRAPGEPGNTDPVGTPPNLEIYTIDTSGGDIRRLTNFPGIDAFPQWSPDGSKLVFRRDLPATAPATGTNAEIFTMDADGGNPVNLSNNAVDDPATTRGLPESFDDQGIWSPDGTRIVFDSFRSGRAPGSSVETADREVYTMNASDGSDVRRITNAQGFDGRCDWGRLVRPAANPQTPPIQAPAPVQPASFEDCPASSANVIRGAASANTITGTSGVTGSSAARVMTWWMLWRATTASIRGQAKIAARAALATI